MKLPLYTALQDEIQRFNHAIHCGVRPTIYRAGRTYIIEYAELESDRLWFNVVKLEWNGVNKHIYIPYIEERLFYCLGEPEWMLLLQQSGLRRNPYFLPRVMYGHPDDRYSR